jgi:endonuclease/exonuclease/phosphatase family metal-dependent hydrolase
MAWAALRREWRALAVNGGVLLFFLFQFMVFNVPLLSVFGSNLRPGEKRVRVMTLNIAYGSRGVEGILEEIERQKPDVLCLQEAREFHQYHDIIPRLLQSLRGWHVARGAEVVTMSRFPIVAQRNYPMPRPSGRTLLETTLNVEGRRLLVFNTHFSTVRPGPYKTNSRYQVLRYGGSAEMRQVQADILLNAAGTRRTPSVVMGDFNNPPRGLVYEKLSERWVDAFRGAGWGFGYTFRSDLPLLRIDYIWAGDGIRVLKCGTPNVRVSDHRPVVADLALPRAGDE